MDSKIWLGRPTLALTAIAATALLVACQESREATAPTDAATSAAIAGVMSRPGFVMFDKTSAFQWTPSTGGGSGDFTRLQQGPARSTSDMGAGASPKTHATLKYRVAHGKPSGGGPATNIVFVEDENGNGKPPSRFFHFTDGRPTIAFFPTYSKSGGQWHVTGGREVFFDANGREHSEVRFQSSTRTASIGETLRREGDAALGMIRSILEPNALHAEVIRPAAACDDPDIGPCTAFIKAATAAASDAAAKTAILTGLSAQCLNFDPVACLSIKSALNDAMAAASAAAAADYIASECVSHCKEELAAEPTLGDGSSNGTSGGSFLCTTWYEGFYTENGVFVELDEWQDCYQLNAT